MTTTFISPDLDALVAEIDIAAPAERVFKALTDPAQLKHWFTSPECPAKIWNMDARLGGKYDYATENGTRVVNTAREVECPVESTENDPARVLLCKSTPPGHPKKQRTGRVSSSVEPRVP